MSKPDDEGYSFIKQGEEDYHLTRDIIMAVRK